MPIVVENLTVSYQKYPAVHHVNCTFEEGAACAIFGPNGAGKSTLLKATMGLIKPETGKVAWQGLEAKDLAYLPQQSEIDRSQVMSVYELTAMGLWYELGCFGGVSASQRTRILDALEQVGMADYAKRSIGSLSSGQFQRVLFARMLVQNAKFLLLDEPFNAMDAKTTFALLSVLQGCLKEGKAIVAVLHDYEQVRAYFSRTLLLARECVADDKTELVLTDANLKLASMRMAHWHDDAAWCETP